MMASNGSSQPTCQNCTTSTTPLWRRDEFGAVLCNACGLFLKLHGRPRPISLKTDVIKSRNRVKTIRPDLAPKKVSSQYFPTARVVSHSPQQQQQQQDAVAAAQAIQRAARSATENNDGTDTFIAQTAASSLYNQGLQSFIVEDPYQTGFQHANGPEGGTGSPINGDRSLDAPQTHEQLIAHNSSLKTRVSELEVINELFRGRLSQLEQQEAAARRGQEVAGVEHTQLRSELEIYKDTETQLRAQLEDSHRRENILKRRLDELDIELNEMRGGFEGSHHCHAKKARTDEAAVKALEPELEAYQGMEPEMELPIDVELQAEAEAEGQVEPQQGLKQHLEQEAEPDLEMEAQEGQRCGEQESGEVVQRGIRFESEQEGAGASMIQ